MKKFFYKAVEINSGIVKSGEIYADTKKDVILKLQKENLVPINVEEKKRKSIFPSLKSKKKLVLEFTEYLLNFLKYKVELSKALLMTYNYIEDENFKNVVNRIINAIKSGISFSQALRENPEYFSSIYANLVESGEKSGNLEGAIGEIYNYLLQTEETKKYIISSLTYPAILFFTGLIATILLVIIVIPRFGQIFTDLNLEPPFLMKILLVSGDFLRNYWISIISIILISIIAFNYFIKKDWFRNSLNNAILNFPIIGKIVHLSDLYRFFRTLSILLKGGNSIISSLIICEKVVFLTELKNAIRNIARKIKQGKKLSYLMRNEIIFPEPIVNLISLSETTGKLEVILENIAEDLNRQIRDKIKFYLTLLEPVAVLLAGFFIGTIVISMLNAIFGINNVGL